MNLLYREPIGELKQAMEEGRLVLKKASLNKKNGRTLSLTLINKTNNKELTVHVENPVLSVDKFELKPDVDVVRNLSIEGEIQTFMKNKWFICHSIELMDSSNEEVVIIKKGVVS